MIRYLLVSPRLNFGQPRSHPPGSGHYWGHTDWDRGLTEDTFTGGPLQSNACGMATTGISFTLLATPL